MKIAASVRNTFAIFLLSVFGACDRGAPNTDHTFASTRYKRDVTDGQSVAARTLSCGDGIQREIADTSRTQLVTFASASDCLSCGSHAAGLEQIRKSNALAVDFMTVAYASEDQQGMVLRALGGLTSEPVCFDANGAYWSTLDLSHTPVTMLIVRGRVAYIHDTSLDTEQARATFTAVVRAQSGGAGAGSVR